jgi:hypothetical protein
MTGKLSLISITIFLGVLATSCGPSASEKEKNRIADSIVSGNSLARQNNNTLDLSTNTPDNKRFCKTAETKFLVNDVRKTSEKIEDLTAKYSGYIIYSNLRNSESNNSRIEISRDSVLLSKKIIVENDITVRIPNENLDSLVRELNKMIVFLDYRIVKLDDLSFKLLANQKASKRLKKYELRQTTHINTKKSKLNETVMAEETMLNRQTQADTLQIQNLAMEDQLNYCTLTIFIYQKPFYYTETQVLQNTDSFRQNLFVRIIDAMIDGWIIFESFIVFLFRIWWFFVFTVGGIMIYKVWLKPKKKQ